MPLCPLVFRTLAEKTVVDPTIYVVHGGLVAASSSWL